MTTRPWSSPPEDAPGRAFGSGFVPPSRRVVAAGPMRRPGRCAVRLTLMGASFAGSWAVFFALGDSWWQLAVAGFLALVSGRIALFTHDVARRRVFRGRRPSEIGGRLFGNLGVGMAYGWWTDEHTARVGCPQVRPFVPLPALEGIALRVASIRALRSATMKAWGTEAVLLLAHITLYLCALFVVLSPGKALAFLLVHQGTFGVCLGRAFSSGRVRAGHQGAPALT